MCRIKNDIRAAEFTDDTVSDVVSKLQYYNHLGVDVTVQYANGQQVVIPARGTKPTSMYDATFKIVHEYRKGARPFHFVDDTNGIVHYNECEIPLTELMKGPYTLAIPFGISIAIAEHRGELSALRAGSPEYQRKLLQENWNRYFKEQGAFAGMVLKANCYDVTKDKLYFESNGFIMAVQVTHYAHLPEDLILVYNNNGNTETESWITVPCDQTFNWSSAEACRVTFRGKSWAVGTNREKLMNMLKEEEIRKSKLVTLDEADYKRSLNTLEMAQEIKNRDREIELTNQALNNERQALSMARQEISSIETNAKQNFALRELDKKQAVSDTEIQLKQLQNQMSLESQKRQLEADIAKRESDLEIAEAKVAKEQISLRNSQVSETGTLVKAAAVAIPAAMGLGMWMSNASSHASLAAVAGGLTGGSGALIAASLITAASVAAVNKDAIIDGVKSIGSSVIDFAGDVGETLLHTAKKGGDFLWKATKSIGRGIRNVANSCWDGVKSIVTHTKDFICSSVESAWEFMTDW